MTSSTSANERGTATATSLPAPVKAGAFWAAVLLPFLALVLLISGLSTTLEYGFFLSIVAVNVVALVVGHDYEHE